MSTKPSIDRKRRYLRAHLSAKLFRIASVCNDGFDPAQLAQFQLVPQFMRTDFKSEDKSDTRTYSMITAFSGAFIKGQEYTTLPFIVSFSNREGVSRSSVGLFAIGCRVKTRERILAFMSVIDYLESSGELPRGSLEEHARRITQSGKLADRVAAVAEYKEFCTRASRDLPYDDLIAA